MVLMLAGFTIAAALALGLADALYWGQPFFSIRHMIEFTLAGRSTRGFQPWYEYARSVPDWANVGTVALALYSTISIRRVASASKGSMSGERRRAVSALSAWAWLPAISLSLLPHKEPRYLVPILPFIAMLTAAALWQAIVWLRQAELTESEPQRERLAYVLTVAVFAMAMTEPMDYVVPRSDDGIAVARYIADVGPTEGVAAEQVWNVGGRAYLRTSNPLLDIDPAQMAGSSSLDAITRMRNIVWLVLQDRDVRRFGCDQLVYRAGFDEVALPDQRGSSCRLFHRR